MFIGTDRGLLNRQDRSVIELFVDTHDRHAGLNLAALNRSLNRRCAAVFRKNRGVHIEKRDSKQLRRKNFSVRDDDAEVRLQRFNLWKGIANFCRLRQR